MEDLYACPLCGGMLTRVCEYRASFQVPVRQATGILDYDSEVVDEIDDGAWVRFLQCDRCECVIHDHDHMGDEQFEVVDDKRGNQRLAWEFLQGLECEHCERVLDLDAPMTLGRFWRENGQLRWTCECGAVYTATGTPSGVEMTCTQEPIYCAGCEKVIEPGDTDAVVKNSLKYHLHCLEELLEL